jgi:RimJ/RimL family protein N-acetyltransferase
MELEDNHIRIRPLRSSDARDLCEHARDEEVIRWTLNVSHPSSEDEAVKLIRRSRYRIRKQSDYAFGIVNKETDKVIGVIELMSLDWQNRNAEISYWLGRKYWGKGLMTEAVRQILRFGFEELGLHRIYARLFEANPESASVLEKAGFTLEGAMRKEQYRHGAWHDMLRYGILSSEAKAL